jgi:hypothetical protein
MAIQKLDRVAKIILSLAILFLSIYIVRKLLPSSDIAGTARFHFVLVALAPLIGILVAWRLGQEARIFCVVILAAVPLLFLVFQEIALYRDQIEIANRESGLLRARAAGKNVSYDLRTALQVLDSELSEGRSLSVPLYPNDYLDGSILYEENGEPAILFGNASNTRMIYCNELGFYRISEGDEYGFPNPAGVITKPPLELLIVGDSFAESACIRQGETFPDLLRTKHPKTVTIGQSTNGPLSNYALMREFVPHLKPKTIVWVHFEGNDIVDLEREQVARQLTRYLDDTYEPRVVRNWKKLQPTLTRLAREKIQFYRTKKQMASTWERYKIEHPTLAETLSLVSIRSRLGMIPRLESKWMDTTLFREILVKADKLAKAHHGSLLFVFIPSWEFFKFGRPDYSRAGVMEVVRELKLPLIDLTPVFGAVKDPLANYPFGQRGHLNPDSSKLVAAEIEKAL